MTDKLPPKSRTEPSITPKDMSDLMPQFTPEALREHAWAGKMKKENAGLKTRTPLTLADIKRRGRLLRTHPPLTSDEVDQLMPSDDPTAQLIRLQQLKLVSVLLERAKTYPNDHLRKLELLSAAKSLLDDPDGGEAKETPMTRDETTAYLVESGLSMREASFLRLIAERFGRRHFQVKDAVDLVGSWRETRDLCLNLAGTPFLLKGIGEETTEFAVPFRYQWLFNLD